MNVTLRELVQEDAAALLNLQHRLDRETSYMLLSPGERQSSILQVEDMIRGLGQAENSLILGAEADGELVGSLSAEGGSFSRNRHSAYIVTGILKRYQGMGIGGALFREMDQWARQCGMVRLELTVMRHNEAAVSLYTKQGFAIEGTKPKSLLVDGEWVDEYYMGKIYS